MISISLVSSAIYLGITLLAGLVIGFLFGKRVAGQRHAKFAKMPLELRGAAGTRQIIPPSEVAQVDYFSQSLSSHEWVD